MRPRSFAIAFLLLAAVVSQSRGGADNMKEMLKRVVEEKITDPYSKQLFLSKFSEMQDCLLDMASMTSALAIQVVNKMVPDLNDCGAKLSSEPDDKKADVNCE
ncbi:uncharacterized protein LOC119372612 [Rhipicephalus sanguineus]|uniref:uncharacterized protein LOC119372612 n=1 Tax=Rhipicephalus sanguineus TaxID=34632 RepID=UPI0020C20B59|nr:uncharacterized protein LOC119372612 [Rhipicephalus sanguineus]